MACPSELKMFEIKSQAGIIIYLNVFSRFLNISGFLFNMRMETED